MPRNSANCISLFTVAINRLILTALLCLVPFLSALAIGPEHSGSWYWPDQSGHGFSIEISELPDGTPVGLVYWNTYDDLGNSMFMVGTGEPYGNQLQVIFECPWGMQFGVFDPLTVISEDGGMGRFEFTDENNATFEYYPSTYTEQNLGHSPINMPLVRLLVPPERDREALPEGQFGYKDLVIAFTKDFEEIWSDYGTGADLFGSFHEPIIPDELAEQGFYLIGDLAMPNRMQGGEAAAIVLVKDVNGDSDCTNLDPDPENNPALCPPDGFKLIYTDLKSGASRDFSVWAPVAKTGYECLGAIGSPHWPGRDGSFMFPIHYDWENARPKDDIYRCVRTDLVVPAAPGDLIWNDAGTGATYNLAVFGMLASTNVPSGEIHLAPGTFSARGDYRRREGFDSEDILYPQPYALRVSIEEEVMEEVPMPSALTSFSPPSPFTERRETAVVRLPWFAVSDPVYDTAILRMLYSPTYTFSRSSRYKLVQWIVNKTDVKQKVQWEFENGTHGKASTTFTTETKVEVKAGVEIKGVFSAGMSISRTFTHSRSYEEGWHQIDRFTLPIEIPPGTAVAAYQIESTFTLLRTDGSQVSVSVPFDRDTLLYDQYPAAQVNKETHGGRIIIEDVVSRSE